MIREAAHGRVGLEEIDRAGHRGAVADLRRVADAIDPAALGAPAHRDAQAAADGDACFAEEECVLTRRRRERTGDQRTACAAPAAVDRTEVCGAEVVGAEIVAAEVDVHRRVVA